MSLGYAIGKGDDPADASATLVEYAGSEYGRRDGSGARKSTRPSSVEFKRHEVTLCMGDTVTVDESYALSVECGRMTLDTRAPTCDDKAAGTR